MRVIGSLGVILRAKKQGLLPSAAEAMKTMCDAGMYLDNQIIRRALQQVGESWNPE